MSTSGTNMQARKLLHALCQFILPVVKSSVDPQTIKDVNDIPLGIEADELIVELERFISICQHSKTDRTIAVEVEFPAEDPCDYLQGTDWIWEITEEKQVNECTNDSNTGVSFQPPLSLLVDTFSVEDGAQAALSASEPELEKPPAETSQVDANYPSYGVDNALMSLKHLVTQYLPIRLLCFEPSNSSLKISLLERGAVYSYLSQKLRNDFQEQWSSNHAASWIFRNTGYAILSHTWSQVPGELTYADWIQGLALTSDEPKCQKLINFCKTAYMNHGFTLGWIDTVCINKESSVELDESIRSMYSWYQRAAICIIYLAETENLLGMDNDRWFSRGWTLQELVAPWSIKFYNMRWNQLNESRHPKNDREYRAIQKLIQNATTITPKELLNIHSSSISRRMELVARRSVTREEDIVYCLMGIFNVSISTAYGEGQQRAFFRLVKEIFDSNKDVSDIFNWGGTPSSMTSLFPSSPSEYLTRATNMQLRPWRPIKPLTLTHLGLRTPILLMSTLSTKMTLEPIGEYYATTSVDEPYCYNERYVDDIPEEYFLLQRSAAPEAGISKEGSTLNLVFGILNVESHGDGIHVRVPKICFAILLNRQYEFGINPSSGTYTKICTTSPIIFNLLKVPNEDGDDEEKTYYAIEKKQLGRHGMNLVTLYL